MQRHIAALSASLVVCLLSGALGTGAARAVTVNIDIGDAANSAAKYVGVGAAPDTGTVWNQTWTYDTPLSLVDSFGNSTGVTLTLNSTWTGASTQTSAGTWFNNLTRDRLYMSGTTQSPQFSLGGLDAAKAYNVYLYMTKHSTAFKLTATGAQRAAIGWTQVSGSDQFHEADIYAAFRGLTGATSYTFTAQGVASEGWNGPGGVYGGLAAIQIQEVPAPGSLRQYWAFDDGADNPASYTAANQVVSGHTALTATYTSDLTPPPGHWVTTGLAPKLVSRVTNPSRSAIDLDPNHAYDYLNGTAYPTGLGIFRTENHPHIEKPLEVYLCPSDPFQGKAKTNVWYAVPTTLPLASQNYAGVLGPHNLGKSSLWGGEPDCHNYSVLGYKECLGSFWRHSHLAPVKIASFLDGTSNTIIIGEVLPEYDDFKYWAMSNGTFASTHAPINYFPAKPFDAWDWKNLESFRSRHPGGAQFAWGDGHVSFLAESIDATVYRGLSTRAKGETVQSP